jgi:PPOX class probable F420-dependent enzyme
MNNTITNAKITVPESHRDLLDVQTAVLATIGKDGMPQLTAMWFLYDDSDATVKLWLLDKRQKTKNLRLNQNATLFILDPRNQFRTLEIRAKATLAPDPTLAVMRRVAAKYGIPDFSMFDEPGDTRSVVTLRPTKINILDEAPPDWGSVAPR